MQPARDDTVLGDFADASFTHFGVTSRFFRRGGRFLVATQGTDGRTAEFEIAYTFGVAPLQQYLVELERGHLQALTVAWDTRPAEQGGQRWFHLYPDAPIPVDDPLHWTGRYQNWNFMCAECHSTDLRRRYRTEDDSYSTTWSDVNVSCEACHGPGSVHVQWARQAADDTRTGDSDVGLVVDFRGNAPAYEIEQCARCHSRRHRVSAEDHPGRPLLDDFMPETLRRDDLYFADGQILGEVYVYGSFLQSRMYRAGVRCTDCHDPHEAEPVVAGNALCTRCHAERPDARFAGLRPKDYDHAGHHFHEPGSAGAQCVACHMPARSYMVVDPRRDHSFRVPRPDLSARLGTPNPCTGCHTDQSNAWAVDTIEKWYGPHHRQGRHYGDIIAAGRRADPAAKADLIALASDSETAPIVAASAIELLSGYGADADLLTVIAASSESADGLVRAKAAQAAEGYPAAERLRIAAPLLADPLRAVRTEAARVLAPLPPEMFDPTHAEAHAGALGEYHAAQQALVDTPAGQLNLAVLHTRDGRYDDAERAYRQALEWDPYFLPARFNLSLLYNSRGRNDDALRVLDEGIDRAPEEGELYYSKGLLLAEMRRLEPAADALGRAATLLPERARVRYNLALVLQRLGRLYEADVALNEAHRLDRRDPEIVNALAIFYAQQQDWARAASFAEKLVDLAPDAPEAQRLLRELRRRAGRG